jgi:hypothetical protein
MRGGSIGPDRLAFALFQTQRRDDRGAEEEDEKKPCSRSAKRAESQVSKQVEDAWKLRQPGQHV